MTSEIDAERDPVEILAESFQARLRRGERPSLEEYAARCPGRAEEIRALFPALVEMEQLRPGVSLAVGPDRPPPAPPTSPAARTPHHPHRLGDYQIVRVIGEGGMGVVYEAEHESLRNRVALKVMHPRFRADAAHLRRFHTEARSAARLHHTNIVPVFDYGEQDGICFYAMPLIDGIGLDAVLQDVRRLRASEGNEVPGGDGPASGAETRSPADTLRAITLGLRTGRYSRDIAAPDQLAAQSTEIPTEGLRDATETDGPVGAGAGTGAGHQNRSGTSSIAGQTETVYEKEIARLASQVADALDHAHRQGVVHRDIKPSNLLLDARGNVWVTDFGLAKLVEGDELSQSHELVGTLRFMAPERFKGLTDRRSDLYALGATLYELLTLRPAFPERDPIRLIEQITHQTPTPPREYDRRIPRDLETIVVKALAKEPRDRFASAGELGDELRRFLEGRPIRSRPVGLAEQFWRWCKRNPGLAAANILAAALTTILAVGSTIAAWTYRGQLEQTRTAQRQGRLALGKSLQAEGSALQRTGLLGQRSESLARLAQAAGVFRENPEGRARLPELRDQAITAMGLTDLKVRWQREIGRIMTIGCDRGLKRYAAIEPLAKASVGGEVVVRRLDDDGELFRAPNPGLPFWYAAPSFSPDGRYLLVFYLQAGPGGFIDVWNLESRQRVCRQSARSGARVFLPDSTGFVFAPPGNDLVVWDLARGREVVRLPLRFLPEFLCVDSEGRRIAANESGSPRPRVQIVDIPTKRTLATWTDQVGNGAMSWSSDDRLMAIGHDDGRIFIWDMGHGRLASVLKGRPTKIIRCQFAPGSHLLATSTWDPTTLLWDAAAGKLLVSAWSSGAFLDFADDGGQLAFYDGSRLGVWDVARGEEAVTLNPGMNSNRTDGAGQEGLKDACFSPDGRWVAVSAVEGTYLHDGHTGRELAEVGSGRADSVLFDRAGMNLITCGDRGLLRWPIRRDGPRGEGRVEIGPPLLLRNLGLDSWFKACWLSDGRALAVPEKAGAHVLLVDASDPRVYRKRVPFLSPPSTFRLTSIAASADGRWAAAGGWKEPEIHVWNLSGRRLEKSLPHGESVADPCALVGFSPDSRWLVSCTNATGASGYYFWETGTWKRGLFLPKSDSAGWGQPLFSPDGRILAACDSPQQIRLFDLATGRTIAHLTTLEPLSPTPMAFSPDGGRLLALTNQRTAVLWNLRRIREQLRAMDVDWDQSSFPPDETSPEAASTPRYPVRVVGEAPELKAREAARRRSLDARLRDQPGDADALIDRGWLDLTMDQATAAVSDLEPAVGLCPADVDAHYLLAQAYKRTGDAVKARAALERYLSYAGEDAEATASKGQLALQLGRFQEAAADFSRALEADPDRDIIRLRRAEAWLGLGRLNEAMAALDPLVLRYPQDPALLELRSQVHERLGHHEQAGADIRRAGESPLINAKRLNGLAWRLATGPTPLRDPQRALAFARRAVELTPGSAMYLNTLGVAEYRAGRYAQAINTLERSLAAGKGLFDGFDLFFLAMARLRLGQNTKAFDEYARATRWLRAHPNLSPTWIQELNAFQAEAENLLDATLPPLPTDPFAPAETWEPQRKGA